MSEQGPDDAADPVGKHLPVRAELVGHDHSGNNPHPKGNRKYFHPHAVAFLINLLVGLRQRHSTTASQLASPMVKEGNIM